MSDGAAPSDAAQSGDGKTDEDRMREFAQCMRDHGIQVEEPKTAPGPDGGAGGGGVAIGIKEGEEGKLKEAQEACQHLMPNGGKPRQLDAAELDKLREHAKCLREHGLDVPDPDPNNPGITMKGDDPEKTEAAFEACQHIMGENGPRFESGGGPR